mmetsp:Transcript_16744/g.46797  ORF Transcript_16744/g.46797 Transcript_16744/m.46797 type:complete len:93 (-) Transcript_16744:1324-1602(-)
MVLPFGELSSTPFVRSLPSLQSREPNSIPNSSPPPPSSASLLLSDPMPRAAESSANWLHNHEALKFPCNCEDIPGPLDTNVPLCRGEPRMDF